MLFRRYGTHLHSVELNFDPNAMTEISFRRDRAHSMTAEEFAAGFELVREESLTATTEGPVQSEAEAALLDHLSTSMRALMAELAESEILLIENEQGVDYPKLHDRKQGIIVAGENRLYFHWHVDPPLRVGLYRRRDS